jgi:hypothetical protein
MASLRGPKLKVERAIKQIDVLYREFTDFSKLNKYQIVPAEYNLNTGRYALRVVGAETDDDWGVLIGEIAHNLRSALDGLAWQLAYLNKWTDIALIRQRPQLSFPVHIITRKQTRAGCAGQVRSILKPLRDCDRTAIEALQPYKYGNLGRRSLLWLLHEINNADKHRLIQVVAGRNVAFSANWGPDPDILDILEINVDFKRPLINGTKVGWATRRFVEEVKMDTIEFFPVMMFWDGCPAVKGRFVDTTLAKMAESVHQIIDSFTPEFS